MKTKEELIKEITKTFPDEDPKIIDKVAQNFVNVANENAIKTAKFKADKKFKDEQEIAFYDYFVKHINVFRTLSKEDKWIVDDAILKTKNIEQLQMIISKTPEEILAVVKH